MKSVISGFIAIVVVVAVIRFAGGGDIALALTNIGNFVVHLVDVCADFLSNAANSVF